MTAKHLLKVRSTTCAAAALVLAMAGTSRAAVSIAGFSFTGASGDQVYSAPTGSVAGLSASNLTRGAGVSAVAKSNSIDSTDWLAASEAAAVAANDFYQFTLTPGTGHPMTLEEIAFKCGKTSSGPSTWFVRSSLDGYTTTLASGAVAGSGSTVSLDGTFSNLSAPVTFRIYAYGASATDGQFFLINLNRSGLRVRGSVAGAPQVTVLDSAVVDEATLRSTIVDAAPGSVFLIKPGSQWTLMGKLNIPKDVSLIGSNFGDNYTFRKGVDGFIGTVKSRVTLYGIVFDGNKAAGRTGGGLVAGRLASNQVDPQSDPVENLMWTRVKIINNADDGFDIAGPMKFSHFQLCNFDNNGGHAVSYGSVLGATEFDNHSSNIWNTIHFNNNGSSAIALSGVEHDSLWTNCEWLNNSGPAFEHFVINQQNAGGSPVQQTTWGATGLSIRGVISGNGPAWVNRGGQCKSIAFIDCRISGNTSTPSGLTSPVGLFHVESGKVDLEIRGGAGWTGNFGTLFTATSGSANYSKLTLTGGGDTYANSNIQAPNKADLVVADTNLLSSASSIHVHQGIGINPKTAAKVVYGP